MTLVATLVPADQLHIPSKRYGLLAAQLLVGIAALSFLLLQPPREGAMLVLPIAAEDGGAAVRYARERGAALLGPGPLPGSIVVRAERSRLLAGAWSAGMLVIAARGGCGGAALTAA